MDSCKITKISNISNQLKKKNSYKTNENNQDLIPKKEKHGHTKEEGLQNPSR
jgi:hypothetical protein